ncbi:uncharacterized protein BDZ99DRAFT_502804 [Mytilinidion resinicola]|uniref:Uncharacterized protein n=1 Tax=Mytilinidion resinicola TaxID=574789 RepID=A0A6A6Y5N5_9PEZI|nr:uncharacterized protein BDZ99DRAFT_502804 [Mytilinidion resinicola]KAF2803970.1 hypothetical protein BDZ99DRAFT_502804 [Mytilinidion resinicola]
MAKLRKALNPFSSSSSSDSPDKNTPKKSRSRSSSPASTTATTTPTDTPTKEKEKYRFSLSDALSDALRPPSRGKPESSPSMLQPPTSDARPRSRGKDKEKTDASSRRKSLDLPRASSKSTSSPTTPPSKSSASKSPVSKFLESTDAAAGTTDWATLNQTAIDNALLAPPPLFSNAASPLHNQYAHDLSPVAASPAPTLAQTLTTSPSQSSSGSLRAAPCTSLATRSESPTVVRFPRPHAHGQLVRGGILVTAWKRWQCCKCGAQTVWEQGVCSNLGCGGEKCGWCGLFDD